MCSPLLHASAERHVNVGEEGGRTAGCCCWVGVQGSKRRDTPQFIGVGYVAERHLRIVNGPRRPLTVAEWWVRACAGLLGVLGLFFVGVTLAWYYWFIPRLVVLIHSENQWSGVVHRSRTQRWNQR